MFNGIPDLNTVMHLRNIWPRRVFNIWGEGGKVGEKEKSSTENKKVGRHAIATKLNQ